MSLAYQQKKSGNIILRTHPLHRIFISIVIAALVLLVVPHHRNALVNVLIVWLAFGFTYLLLNWIVLFNRPIPEIRRFAQQDDGSKTFVFVMIMLFSFSCLIIVLILISTPSLNQNDNTLFSTLFPLICVAGIIASWFLIHTTYTFHYAHMYYDNAVDDETKDAQGLSFPDCEEPDYIDFAYFSFVIGCCFQVSDVTVNSRLIRRSVLLHQLLSFGLNTFLVALTINLIAGLKH
jgi:uncharacterized membrane protein